jgi:hypothetical protein
VRYCEHGSPHFCLPIMLGGVQVKRNVVMPGVCIPVIPEAAVESGAGLVST